MREKTEGIYQYKQQLDCSCKPEGKNPITNIKQGENRLELKGTQEGHRTAPRSDKRRT